MLLALWQKGAVMAKSRRSVRPNGPVSDADKIRRVTGNLTKLMVLLLRAMDGFATTSKPLRTRILADLNSIAKEKTAEGGTELLGIVVSELDARFGDQKVLASLGKALALKARSKHTVKVDGEGNCLGTQGFGIKVSVNGTSAGACVTGTPGNITGGGVSGGFSY
jgi:hypothetical protein